MADDEDRSKNVRSRTVAWLRRLAGVGAVTVGPAVVLVLVLSLWAKCTDLGPAATVHPAIRTWDAGRRGNRIDELLTKHAPPSESTP